MWCAELAASTRYWAAPRAVDAKQRRHLAASIHAAADWTLTHTPGATHPLCPAVEGPVPDVERVAKVILAADLTPDGIINHEIAAARERRRQRRLTEAGGAPGGPPQGGGYAAGAGASGMSGQKRKALAEYDSGSESDYDEPHGTAPIQQQYDATAGGGGGPDAGNYGGAPTGGLDIYRMRRKQQRA